MPLPLLPVEAVGACCNGVALAGEGGLSLIIVVSAGETAAALGEAGHLKLDDHEFPAKSMMA